MKTRNVAVHAASAAAMLTSAPALAQNAGAPSNPKDVANRFSQSNTVCGAYSLFISQCIANKDHKQSFASAGEEFFNRAYLSGQMAGLSEKVLTQRVNAATEQMSADTKNSCDNMKVLLEKHGNRCKALFEAGPKSSALAAPPK